MIHIYTALLQIVQHYGYPGIFLALILGVLGLPVPDEVLMTFAGFLVFKHQLNFFMTIGVAFIGSVSGMSISFLVGNKFGTYLIQKQASLLKKIENAETWFEKYGRFAISIGYFVPGFRHLSAFFAGMSNWKFTRFFPYAMLGGFLWTGSFITLGYFVGEKWAKYSFLIHRYSRVIVVFAVLGVGLYFLIRTAVSKIKKH